MGCENGSCKMNFNIYQIKENCDRWIKIEKGKNPTPYFYCWLFTEENRSSKMGYFDGDDYFSERDDPINPDYFYEFYLPDPPTELNKDA